MGRMPVYAVSTETVRQLDRTPLIRDMPKRMERAERFRFERDRLLCVGGGFLMRQVVGIRDESELRRGRYGKPYAPGYPPFSLSHSGDWCILSTWETEVGVDIEPIDEKNLTVAPMVCTPGELAWMSKDPPERFYLLWTWKESLIKAGGMSLEPRSFDVLPFTEGRPLRLNGRLWYGASDSMAGYRFSACAALPMDGLAWVELGPDDFIRSLDHCPPNTFLN